MDITETRRFADREFQLWLDQRQRTIQIAFERSERVIVQPRRCATAFCGLPADRGPFCHSCQRERKYVTQAAECDRTTLELSPAEVVALEEWQSPESGCDA